MSIGFLLHLALLATCLSLSLWPHLLVSPRQERVEKQALEHARLKVEITGDGTFVVDGKPTTLATVTKLSREVRLIDPKAKLQIIATEETNVLDIKRLVKAASEGGINDIIFSAYPGK